jgi:hypothetical protein
MLRPDPADRLNLPDPYSGGRVQVDLESFFDFSFWLSEQLQELITQHRPDHLPPPRELSAKKKIACQHDDFGMSQN